ncbi:exportin-2 [Sarcoptes scabiei]|nr:exportin-2 [Sarcoptes scabiei]
MGKLHDFVTRKKTSKSTIYHQKKKEEKDILAEETVQKGEENVRKKEAKFVSQNLSQSI